MYFISKMLCGMIRKGDVVWFWFCYENWVQNGLNMSNIMNANCLNPRHFDSAGRLSHKKSHHISWFCIFKHIELALYKNKWLDALHFIISDMSACFKKEDDFLLQKHIYIFKS